MHAAIDLLFTFGVGGYRLVRMISPEIWIHLLTPMCTVY